MIDGVFAMEQNLNRKSFGGRLTRFMYFNTSSLVSSPGLKTISP